MSTVKGIITVAACLLLLLCAGAAGASAPGKSSAELITAAYKAGAIDTETYIVQKVRSYLLPATVDVRFRSIVRNAPSRELTLLLADARKYWGMLSPDAREFLAPLFKRPTDTTYTDSDLGVFNFGTNAVATYDSTNFRMHYTTGAVADGGGHTHNVPAADTDGDGTPDYVETMSGIFEWSFNQETKILKYDAPPKDDGTAAQGGNDKFDVYILNCGAGSIYGFAVPETQQATTGDRSNEYSSFMVMDNDMAEFTSHTQTENIQVTACHEFHHAVQFGYNTLANSWYKEATSAWMEDQVYDAVNDNYQYLNGKDCAAFFYNPEISLDHSTSCANGDHWYGTWIFNEYLKNKWGQDTIRSVWDNLDPVDKNTAVDAIETVLTGKSSSWKTAFTEFAAKNYSQKGFYKDALHYSKVPYFATYTLDYSGAATHKVDEKTTTLKNLSTKYYQFKPGPTLKKPAVLTIEVDGADGKDINAVAIAKKKDGTFVEYAFSLDDTEKKGEVGVGAFSADTMIEVMLAVVNHSKTEDDLEVKYKAELKKGFSFVIDSTGSMGEEIEAARAAAKKVLADNKAASLDLLYTLITFADGSGSIAGQSSDEDVMTALINTVSANGGNGCPESSLLSIRQAANLSEGSDILMMTDASSNSYGVDDTYATWGEVYETITLLLDTNSRLHTIIYGDCDSSYRASDKLAQCPTCSAFGRLAQYSSGSGDSSGSDGYSLISAETGGLSFTIGSSETETAAEMILRAGTADSTVAIYDGTDNATYAVPVDSSITKLQLVLNAQDTTGASLAVTDPSGATVDNDTSGVTVLTAGGTLYYIIEDPALATGVWSAAVGGSGDYRITAEATTSNAMDYTGDTVVAVGEQMAIEAGFREAVSGPQFYIAELDGSGAEPLNLSAEDELTYVGTHTLDEVGSYRFRVTADGNFQRMYPGSISVSEIAITTTLPRQVRAGDTVTHTFTLENNGAEQATFDLFANTTLEWSDISGVADSVTLAGGSSETISIVVTVPADAVSGDIDDLSLQAVSQANPLIRATGKTETGVVPLYDFDADGDVDADDLLLVSSRWNLTSNDALYDAAYDIDLDGDIDVVDIMQVSAQIGLTE